MSLQICQGSSESTLQVPATDLGVQKLSFLASLSKEAALSYRHPEAVKYTNFAKTKSALARKLYGIYNKNVFGGNLPANMSIEWSRRLTKTAGRCHLSLLTKTARIVLSVKVVDSCERLRDTLVHEMCHAASWIISGLNDSHGPQWVWWTKLAMERFPELPTISRAHTYNVRTKFCYKCVTCGYEIGRHTKSLDTKVCGQCQSKFELVAKA